MVHSHKFITIVQENALTSRFINAGKVSSSAYSIFYFFSVHRKSICLGSGTFWSLSEWILKTPMVEEKNKDVMGAFIPSQVCHNLQWTDIFTMTRLLLKLPQMTRHYTLI